MRREMDLDRLLAMSESAINFVMYFYDVSRDIAIEYYLDEVKAAEQLLSKEIIIKGLT